jgi:hypothetical protein
LHWALRDQIEIKNGITLAKVPCHQIETKLLPDLPRNQKRELTIFPNRPVSIGRVIKLPLFKSLYKRSNLK